jgi:hypothetical protein
MNSLRRHLSYANVVATLALVFAMSGGALAAKHYLINSTKQINPKVLKKLRGNQGPTGPAGIAIQGPSGFDGAKGARGERGPEGPAGLSALSALPSGQSESGAYGIFPANTGSSGILVTAVTFPMRLETPIPASQIIYTPAGLPVTHCSGPGHADRGYLCIYPTEHGGVNTPPAVFEPEESANTGTSRVGFGMKWTVTGTNAGDVGSYTVTAP